MSIFFLSNNIFFRHYDNCIRQYLLKLIYIYNTRIENKNITQVDKKNNSRSQFLCLGDARVVGDRLHGR